VQNARSGILSRLYRSLPSIETVIGIGMLAGLVWGAKSLGSKPPTAPVLDKIISDARRQHPTDHFEFQQLAMEQFRLLSPAEQKGYSENFQESLMKIALELPKPGEVETVD